MSGTLRVSALEHDVFMSITKNKYNSVKDMLEKLVLSLKEKDPERFEEILAKHKKGTGRPLGSKSKIKPENMFA